MKKSKLYYLSALANVNSSILNISLTHGFKIESMPDQKFYRLISTLEGVSWHKIAMRIVGAQQMIGKDKRCYYIKKTVMSDKKMDKNGRFSAFPSGFNKITPLINKYLNPTIHLMRFFKEGNICTTSAYFYFIDSNGNPEPFMTSSSYPIILPGLYSLKKLEINDLMRFVRRNNLPFADPMLQLSFENFEISYLMYNKNLSFLSLMMALEGLLNPGGVEISYKISRNAAVLLGNDISSARSIFKRIKYLYNKRSKIIHSGRTDIVTQDTILELRKYVRDAIKRIAELKVNKKQLIEILNEKGYGRSTLDR